MLSRFRVLGTPNVPNLDKQRASLAGRSGSDATRKILEVRGEAIRTCAGAEARPEFLALLLEAGRFATYVGLMKGEGWSIAEVRGISIFADIGGRVHPPCLLFAMHLVHAFSRGLGILVFAITFAFSLVANLICNCLADDHSRYWNEHAWPFCYSLLASGIVCWHIGAACERSLKRQETDPDYDPTLDVPEHNDFFRIPVKWWGLILMATALICLIGDYAPKNF